MPPNNKENKRLYLIDGYAMLYRAHFAMIRNPLINSKGMHTSALFGFVNQIMKLINTEKPDLMIAAFDSPQKTFRHERYSEYKATREKMPEEMIEQLPYLWNILESMDIPLLEEPGFEADDIIGTLCKNTQEFGQYEDVMIVSADKDFLQLQRYKNVRQYSPLLKKEYREETPLVGLTEKILTGDAGDGVPNVLSHDNVFVEGERQRPLSRKKKDDMINQLNHADSGYQHSEWYRNYQRNRKLIDLEYTPEELQSEILEQFNNQDKWAQRGAVLPYLINNRMKLMIESVEELI